MSIYDPRDYIGGPDRYEEPPLPGDDSWNGPEDDDEPTDEVASYLRHPSNGPLRLVRECGHRFPHRRCPYCGDDV